METATLAPHFWAAVEDCLMTFHQRSRCEAAEMVLNLFRRLPTTEVGSDPAFGEMIYHAEPWQIACNLADNDLPISEHQQAYENLLQKNGLTTVGDRKRG